MIVQELVFPSLYLSDLLKVVDSQRPAETNSSKTLRITSIFLTPQGSPIIDEYTEKQPRGQDEASGEIPFYTDFFLLLFFFSERASDIVPSTSSTLSSSTYIQ